MFKCKVCAEKDKRIEDLKTQVDSLLSMVSPKTSAHTIPLNQIEADAILTGRDEVIEVEVDNLDTRRQQELIEIEREAQRILAGTY